MCGRWMSRLLLLAALGGISSNVATTYGASVSPRSLVLRQKDVPKGFKLAASGPVSNADAAPSIHMTGATMQRKGRITGYQVEYTNSKFAFVGVAVIQSSASTWTHPAGAHWGLLQDKLKVSQHNPASMRVVRSPRVGDESLGFTWTATATGYSSVYYAVVFRRGSTLNDVVVGGIDTGRTLPDISIDDAVKYARIADRHSQAA